MSSLPPAQGPDESPSDEQWEAFLRDAMEGGGAGAPKEASARDRLAAARVRRPRRPRRPRSGTARSATAWLAAAAPWTAVAAVVVFGAFQMGLIPVPRSSPPAPAAGSASGPAEAVSLPGGGTSDGDQCGTKGYHHFPLPAGATDVEPPSPASPASGPQLSLSHYGYAADPDGEGGIVIGLRFTTPGTKKPLRVSRTLGGEGAAVEIEGPDGLVAGAHGLPVSWPSAARASASGASGASGASVDVSDGGGGEIVVPAEALCPGHDGDSVARSLVPPADSTGTVTGPPPYRLVVSLRDPAVGTLRTTLGLPAGGGLLSAVNLVPAARS
ncbi:hypothetical protein HEP81_03269 [Streptomyces griseofuscus]|uniref:Uncharacterized protein n=1 Tax=Streptomyces griseofuscus TaxID=146922 RepID=A0A7H1PZU9_9ACTN|nr:hypothetical protein [Streptomyces griseofuscus]QNT93579.1 hypothetical protein HEP81_03269 [Streptomyces griseofuscus]BBC94234.1 hypothetical protein SRO_3058 [Streptomyces rochei]